MTRGIVNPFELMQALRLICWITGELKGYDVLVNASAHLRRRLGWKA